MLGFKNLSVIGSLLLSKALKKDSIQRKRVDRFLARSMGDNKGMWLKLGQLLSVNSYNTQDFSDLSSGAGVQLIDEQDFELYIQSLFAQENIKVTAPISLKHPGTAASLSQVHEIILESDEDELANPRQWVIKAKLPGIEEIIAEQLKVFKIFEASEGFAPKNKAFRSKDYSKTFKESFEKELNYKEERSNMTKVKSFSKLKGSMYIPQLHSLYQGSDFIVMEKVSGQSWQEVTANWSYSEKRRLGHQLIDQYIYQYFIIGLAQGDFHPGNFLFSKDDKGILISWIDFGQCLRPTPKQQKALFLAIEETEDSSMGDLFNAWNFDLKKLTHLADRLPLILRTVFEPLHSTTPTNLKNWNLKEKLELIMSEEKWWFRTAGSSELFLSIKSWLGLIGMLEKLDVALHFNQVWVENKATIETKLNAITLDSAPIISSTFKDIAKSLVVKITEGNKVLVDVSLPARTIENLQEFLSPGALAEMAKNSINIEEVVKSTCAKGLVPQKVLELTVGDRTFFVALE